MNLHAPEAADRGLGLAATRGERSKGTPPGQVDVLPLSLRRPAIREASPARTVTAWLLKNGCLA